MTRRIIALSMLVVISGTMPEYSDASADQERHMVFQSTNARGETISRRIGLTLPPTATVEYAEEIDGLDDAARLTVVLPDADWQKLRSSLPLAAPDQPPFTADANFHLGLDEGSWAPGKAKELQTIQLPWHAGAESLNLGVAPADAGYTRLFIFWHRL